MTTEEIDSTIEEGESLKSIAQAYSEIANLKIKRLRGEVERNRIFFDEILKVYGLVRTLAIKQKIAVVKPKKSLCILLTSNYRFYGNINSSLVNYFTGSTRELKDIDRIVLGKEGVNFFKTAKVLPDYKEIILKSDMPTNEELLGLAKISSDYNQVLVFHSKLKSLLNQRATFTDVTAASLYLKGLDSRNKEAAIRFIFEPELSKILAFFNNQVLTLLLEQTFLESELSRTASRFISMDQAETNADTLIKKFQTLKAYDERNTINNTVLENFASMMAIRKETRHY